jgi:hypothetical protein
MLYVNRKFNTLKDEFPVNGKIVVFAKEKPLNGSLGYI